MDCSRRSFIGGTRNFFLRKSLSGERALTQEDYVNLLRKEYLQWKAIYKFKTREFENLKEKKPVILSEEQILSKLDDEAKQYLENAPSYSNILRQAKSYVQWLLIAKKLEEDFEYQYETSLEHVLCKRNALIDDLLSEIDAVCEKCDHSLCTVQIHPLTSISDDFYRAMVPEDLRI